MPSTKSSSILRHQQQLAMRLIRSSATLQSTPVRRFSRICDSMPRLLWNEYQRPYRLLVSTDQSSHTFSEWSSLRFSISACDNFRNEVETPPVKILPRSFTSQMNPVAIAHIKWCRLLPLLLFNRSSLDLRDQSVYCPRLAIGVDVEIFNISTCWAV